MRVLILGHDDVKRALPPEECADAMARVLAMRARGEAYNPLRSIMVPPGAAGFMGLMPGWRAAGDDAPASFALKAICLIPDNPTRGLDTHQGIVTLFDGEIGVPTAILDASAITDVRTAAVTAVATRALAREDARTLAILGAGVQARSHLRALLTVRDFDTVRVYAPTAEHARAVLEDAPAVSAATNMTVAASAEEAVRGADVVVTATSSQDAGARARLARARARTSTPSAPAPRPRASSTSRPSSRARCSATAASRSRPRPGSTAWPSSRGRSTASTTSGPSSARC